jgi:hypothetical protein
VIDRIAPLRELKQVGAVVPKPAALPQDRSRVLAGKPPETGFPVNLAKHILSVLAGKPPETGFPVSLAEAYSLLPLAPVTGEFFHFSTGLLLRRIEGPPAIAEVRERASLP